MPSIPLKYVLPLLGLTLSAFVFNTSEFMPIGLLTDIAQSFAMTPAEAGVMITVYAWMVGLLSLPLMLFACRMDLRRLLLLTLALFTVGQAGAGIAASFPALLAARIAVACAHSVFWSIAAPLATRLVTREHQPFALSLVAAGSSVAMVFGLPLGRVVGLALGWRTTFLCIAAISFLTLIYLCRVFPPLPRGEQFSPAQLPSLVRQPLIAGMFLLSLLYATAYFTAYSYIEPFLSSIAHFAPSLITVTLMVLGVMGFCGSFLFSHCYGRCRFGVLRAGLAGLTASLALFLPAAASLPLTFLVCMVLGTISTCFNLAMQAELIRHTSRASSPVAMAIFSGIFNVGIGGGTFLGGQASAAGLLADVGLLGAAIAAVAAAYLCLVYIPQAKKRACGRAGV